MKTNEVYIFIHRLIGAIATGVAIISASGAPIDVSDRIELFVDDVLIESHQGTSLRLANPRAEEIAFKFDQPWEGPWAGAHTVIHDRNSYKLYYRGAFPDKDGKNSADGEVTCYAESKDGISWTKPSLGLHEFKGSKQNNIIMPLGSPVRASSTFAPFVDNRPGVPASERYKAIGGLAEKGLFRFVSADGIRWQPFSEEPLFLGYALDTLNVALWSATEQQYVAYIRTWTGGSENGKPKFTGIRTISRSTSKDFKTWTTPEPMSFGNTPMEHLYTIGAQPYFRAPHIVIAMPFRFVPDKQVFNAEEVKKWGWYSSKGTSDGVLMSSRGGLKFHRAFMESFVRPGLDRWAWVARSNMPSVGVVPTGESEMSFFVTSGYTTENYHMRRYSLRTDGFISVNAPFAGGEMRTKLLRFSGDELVINYSTSSIGSVRVELLDESGKPLPDFSLADCDEIVGDQIGRTVTWKGQAAIGTFKNKPVRLRFVMKDADLYSVQFR